MQRTNTALYAHIYDIQPGDGWAPSYSLRSPKPAQVLKFGSAQCYSASLTMTLLIRLTTTAFGTVQIPDSDEVIPNMLITVERDRQSFKTLPFP